MPRSLVHWLIALRQIAAVLPLSLRIDKDEREARGVLDRCTVLGKGHDGNGSAAGKLVFHELANRGLDFGLLVERSTPVADDLLQRRLVMDAEAVGPDLADEEACRFESVAALSIDVVSTSGSPSAKRSSGRCATLSVCPPEDSNRIAVPTRRWMSRSGPLVSASSALAWDSVRPAMSASNG